MNWSWNVSVEPISEPLSLTDAKAHLRITDSVEDDLVTAYIVAARKWIEHYTNSSIATQTLVLKLDRFPYDGQSIMLPQSPVANVTSVQYVDVDGNTQTWASSNYKVDTSSEPARLEPSYNVSYPTTRHENNAVTVTYVVGPTSLSADILHALKLVVGGFYNMRESECPQQAYQSSFGVRALLDSHKLYYRGPWIEWCSRNDDLRR